MLNLTTLTRTIYIRQNEHLFIIQCIINYHTVSEAFKIETLKRVLLTNIKKWSPNKLIPSSTTSLQDQTYAAVYRWTKRLEELDELLLSIL